MAKTKPTIIRCEYPPLDTNQRDLAEQILAELEARNPRTAKEYFQEFLATFEEPTP